MCIVYRNKKAAAHNTGLFPKAFKSYSHTVYCLSLFLSLYLPILSIYLSIFSLSFISFFLNYFFLVYVIASTQKLCCVTYTIMIYFFILYCFPKFFFVYCFIINFVGVNIGPCRRRDEMADLLPIASLLIW